MIDQNILFDWPKLFSLLCNPTILGQSLNLELKLKVKIKTPYKTKLKERYPN